MKKIVLFVITSILFTVVLLSVKDSYSAYTKNVQTSLEVTTPKLEAVFLPGTEFNSKIKQIAGNSGATYQTDDNNIISIQRTNILTITPTVNNIVSTNDSSFPIYAWFSSGVLYYYTEVEHPYLNEDSSYMFYRLRKVENILSLVSVNTSSTITMREMFAGAHRLINIDLSNFDTNNVTDMRHMFYGANVLENLDISSFDMSKVINTDDMIIGLTKLKDLKTPKVYPNNTSVTIDLGKTMYDGNNIVYTTLGRSTNPTSLTETWIKEGYIVSFDYNDSTNYGRGFDDTITNFTGAANYGGFSVRIDVAGFSVGDVLQLEFDYEGTNLTANSGSYMTFQSCGHISGWNHELGVRDYFFPLGNVSKTHKILTVQLSQADIDEEYYGGNIRTDHYTGGSITFSNFKVSRITKNSIIKMYDEQVSEFPSPTKLGYTFAGWFSDSVGGTQISSPIQTLTSDVTYYAHWTPNSYNLTINPNGGTYNGSASNKVVTQSMDSYYGLQIPVREGYTFTGWTISGNGEVLRGNASGRPSSQATIYTDTDGSQYFKYAYSNYVTGDGYAWPSYQYSFYNYTVGHTYKISFDTRINLFSGLNYITYRHASVGNDYHSGLVAVTLGGDNQGLGWQHFDMLRTFESSTHPILGVEITPNFEIYTEILPNSTASIDMDIKNIIITDMSTGEQLMPSEFNGYIYKYGVNGATLTANWVTTMTNNTKDYSYNGTTGSDGSVQTFIAPVSGTYKLETWGAQGGSTSHSYAYGGYGGYSTAEINLSSGNTLIVNVGGQPASNQYTGTEMGYSSCSFSSHNGGCDEIILGGYNGGGNGSFRKDAVFEAGGGATDVRTNSTDLNSRIIVSGGGGGGSFYNELRYGVGGSGGGYSGVNGRYGANSNCESYGMGGTQSEGGSYYVLTGHAYYDSVNIPLAGFGYGGAADAEVGGSGGGSGWYGGRGTSCLGGAGGGSGYINSTLANKKMYCYDCQEDLTNANTFTVSTTGSSSYKDTTACPSGYSSSPVSKCAKAGNGYARITLVSVE